MTLTGWDFIISFGMQKKSHYMKRFITAIIAIVISVATALPQDKAAYELLHERMTKRPSEEVFATANEYLKKQHEDTAIVLFSIIFARYKNNNDEKEKQLCAKSCMIIADIYFEQGNYAASLDYLIRGTDITATCTDKSLMPHFYLRLGNVYNVFQDYEKGINCYLKGYSLCKDSEDKDCQYSLANNLTGAYNYIKDTENAKKYYALSKKLTPADDHMKIYLNMLNEGLIQTNDGQFHKAAATLQQSAHYAVEHNLDPRSECSSYEELYRLYKTRGMTDSTLYFLNKCNELANRYNFTDIIVENLKSYSEIYEKTGNRQKALDFKSQYLDMSDSIFNNREFNRIKNQQYIYETGQYEKEISLLNLQQEKDNMRIRLQRQALAIAVTGIVLLGVLLLVVLIQKRKLAAAYKNIFNVNTEIVESEKHSKMLMAQYEERLKAAESHTEPESEEQQATEQADNDDNEKTYANSAASKEKKQELLEAINRIMTTTEEYCQPDFSLEKLASLVNSNNTYVSQVINENYKKNFSTFLNEYRIKEARARLADFDKYGNYTIRAIYESVGYRSNSAFINSFKNIVGITPSTFKNMVKEEHERQGKE